MRMGKQKTTRRKKRRTKTARKNVSPSPIIRIFLGTTILIILVLTAGLLTHHFLLRKPRVGTLDKTITGDRSKGDPPPYEIYPKDDAAKRIESKGRFHKRRHRPKVALIIDDMGYNVHLAKKFADLQTMLTFSVLPHSPHQRYIAKLAHARGFEVMLHLPMEPNEYPRVQPGPGTLFADMPSAELIHQLNENLDAVPFISGVNNHMGSKMTTLPRQMDQIFLVLKKRRLFFIDSRSTPRTVCRASARLIQLPFAERDVFIDHVVSVDFIHRQLDRLVAVAQFQGHAIGIMHPHDMTLEVLKANLPRLKKQLTFVPASDLTTRSP